MAIREESSEAETDGYKEESSEPELDGCIEEDGEETDNGSEKGWRGRK